MISVVVALYNSMSFIEEQLDSIRNQTVPVDEVIMIDDCSSDGTVEWIREYIYINNLKNWRLEYHEKNKGYIATFYDAIEKSTGDIIILCDHDDVWLDDKVSIIKKEFEQTKDMLMLATSFEQIDAEGKSIPVKPKRYHANNNLIRRSVQKGVINKMTFYDIAIYNLSPGCTCAISSSLKKSFLNVNSKCILPHDWTLSVLAALKGGLYYFDSITTKYRIYDKNTIGLGHESRFENRKKIVQNNYFEKKDITKLVLSQLGKESKEYNYCERILDVFKLRYLAMKKRNPLFIIPAFIKSLGLDHLYESVLMDFVTIIKI